MNYIGKCYTVISDDEETMAQWPEIKTGFSFQILRVDDSSAHPGVTRLRCLTTNKVIDIEDPVANGGDSWFWCIFYLDPFELDAELKYLGEKDYIDMHPQVLENTTSSVLKNWPELYTAINNLLENASPGDYDIYEVEPWYVHNLQSVFSKIVKGE